MNNWQKAKAEADLFLPEARRVIRLVLPDLATVEVAPEHEDTLNATDLIVDNVRAWAWRMRMPSCTYRDFTVRAHLSSGSKTELAKLLDGHGDFYLYSWTDQQRYDESRFSEWAIFDLDRFRDGWSTLEPLASKQTNGYGDSDFLAWSVGVLEDAGVVARSKMLQPSLFDNGT